MRKPIRYVPQSPYEDTTALFVANSKALTFLSNGIVEVEGNGEVLTQLRLRRVSVLRQAGDDADGYILVNMKADLYDYEFDKILEKWEEIGSMATCAVNLYNRAQWRMSK